MTAAQVEQLQSKSGAQPIVEATGLSKQFGLVVANDNVDLTLWPGEVHAVLGENGAGKTTLMNMLSGIYRPDSGEIRIDSQPINIETPTDALSRGIGTVYQHFTLVPNLSVIENVILGTDTGFRLDLSESEQKLQGMLSDFELNVSPETEVRHLSIGQRQRVEIVKVLFRGTRVLLLDEPTSVLTPGEVRDLFRIINRLRDQGVAVVLITHKLDEALDMADRITVLRLGRVVDTISPDHLGPEHREEAHQRVVSAMFGGAVDPQESIGSGTARSNVLMSLRTVAADGDRGDEAVTDVSIDLHAGEIFGIAGVDGNGQKELGEVVAGQRKATSGSILIDGSDITNKGVLAATKAGVGYVTDDRLGEGSVPGSSVADNAVLKTIARRPFSRRFWLDRKAIDAHAKELIDQFDVRTPDSSTKIALLSGGNIQKLLLARELAMEPRVLVCNKPTYGLDVRTAHFVLTTLREQADSGKSVMLISSELDEVLEVSDRVGVMYNGEIVAIFDRADADREEIGRLMLSGRQAMAEAVPA